MKYAALLRGIAPMNPNMKNEKLRGVFEDLGFKSVASVISSGNIIFESGLKDAAKLEAKIEPEWPKKLGFKSTTIVRSLEELEALYKKDPFKNIDTKKYYTTVTFLKHKRLLRGKLPEKKNGGIVVAAYGREVCIAAPLGETPNLMQWIEKEFGKEVTTRTWKTVGRIIAKLA